MTVSGPFRRSAASQQVGSYLGVQQTIWQWAPIDVNDPNLTCDAEKIVSWMVDDIDQQRHPSVNDRLRSWRFGLAA